MRKTPLRPGKGFGRRRQALKATGRVKKSNPERQAKKRARYKSYLSSRVWKEKRKAALEAAGHQCESWHPGGSSDVRDGGVPYSVRCPATERLTVHHRTYARFGGKELPEDLAVLCKSCHDRWHAVVGTPTQRAS